MLSKQINTWVEGGDLQRLVVAGALAYPAAEAQKHSLVVLEVEPSEDQLAVPCLEEALASRVAADRLAVPYLEAELAFLAELGQQVGPYPGVASACPSVDPVAEVDYSRPIRVVQGAFHRAAAVPCLVGAPLVGASLEIQEVLGDRAFHPEGQTVHGHAFVDRASLVPGAEGLEGLASLGREDLPCHREVPALADSVQIASTLRS
jgi:hypothetical protein